MVVAINKKFILLVLLVMGGLFLYSVIGGINLGGGTSKSKITCDIDIKNPFYIGQPKIDTLNCVRKACLLGLSLFSNSGNIQMVVDNQVIASSSYKVTEGGSTRISLSSQCTNTNYGAIILRNENGVEIDRKGFTL